MWLEKDCVLELAVLGPSEWEAFPRRGISKRTFVLWIINNEQHKKEKPLPEQWNYWVLHL